MKNNEKKKKTFICHIIMKKINLKKKNDYLISVYFFILQK